jgi:predicted regulator of Ras-like GTPase activity (Roadblock/LC7/MglB family)
MSLTEILYETVELVEGARMVGIIGTDGISVELVMDEESVPHGPDEAEMELAWLASTAAFTANRLSAGYAYELTLATDELTYLLLLVTHNYYAVIGVTPDSSFDEARIGARRMVERIYEEI